MKMKSVSVTIFFPCFAKGSSLIIVTSNQPLREKCPYFKFSWSVFSGIRTGYEEVRRYSVQMPENKNQKNSEYGHFSRSVPQIQSAHPRQ